jgi:hypothetical protein
MRAGGPSVNPKGRPREKWALLSQEVKELAASHGPECIERLVGLMRTGETETTRGAAMKGVTRSRLRQTTAGRERRART